MTIPTYSTGTVSVAANGTVVTGSGGPLWLSNVKPGDWISIDQTDLVMVLDVTADNKLTILPWKGGAKTNVAYVVVENYSARDDSGEIAKSVGLLVAAQNVEGFIWFVPSTRTVPDPSRGDEGQWAYQPSTGKQWVKQGGLWVYVGLYKAFGTPAPYDAGKSYSLNDVATLAGSSYVWINPVSSAGHAPPDPTYWTVLASLGFSVFKPLTPWAAGQAYLVGPPAAFVSYNGSSYACVVNHTSTASFENDLAAGVWVIVASAPVYGGTSTTTLTVGPGAKVFQTQSNLLWRTGARVRAASSRQNLLLQPTNLDQAPWTSASGLTVTPNTDVGPDGTLSVDTLNDLGPNYGQRVQTVSITPDNSTYRLAVIFKRSAGAGASSALIGVLSGGTTKNCTLNFNGTTGAALSASGAISFSAYDIGGGFSRAEGTIANNGTNNLIGIYITPAGLNAADAASLPIVKAEITNLSAPITTTSDWMEGVITYSGTTLSMNVDKIGGNGGTFADWNFNPAGEPGKDGTNGANGAPGVDGVMQGDIRAAGVRLSLTSGTPVTTADVNNTAIYLMPSGGGFIAVWDTANNKFITVKIASQIVLLLDANSAHGNFHQIGRTYDLFYGKDQAGVFRFVSGPPWEAGAVAGQSVGAGAKRGTGAGSTELEIINGVPVNKNVMVARFGAGSGDLNGCNARELTYVGSFTATANGVATDMKSKRLLFNAYNREMRALRVSDPAVSWDYSLAAWRQAHGLAANQLEILDGLGGLSPDIKLVGCVTTTGSTAIRAVRAAIGLDSATQVASDCLTALATISTGIVLPMNAFFSGPIGLGKHEMKWMEYGGGGDTQTWYSTDSINANFFFGMVGSVVM